MNHGIVIEQTIQGADGIWRDRLGNPTEAPAIERTPADAPTEEADAPTEEADAPTEEAGA